MATVTEATAGKTRDLPISPKLRALLAATAAATGIDDVRVTSGGQCAKGTCTKRTGSVRHDLGQAADLELRTAGRSLDFTDPADLPAIVAFVTEAARRGATGIGAGVDYMGPRTLHVGYGSRAVWGAGGKAANAPRWLIDAALAGWRTGAGAHQKRYSAVVPFDALASDGDVPLALFDSEDPEVEDDHEHRD